MGFASVREEVKVEMACLKTSIRICFFLGQTSDLTLPSVGQLINFKAALHFPAFRVTVKTSVRVENGS